MEREDRRPKRIDWGPTPKHHHTHRPPTPTNQTKPINQPTIPHNNPTTKKQALRDAGVPLATAAAALSAGTHPSGSSTNPSTTAGAAALLLGGGGAAAAAAVAWYGGLVGAGVGGEEAAVAGVAAAAGPSSAGVCVCVFFVCLVF